MESNHRDKLDDLIDAALVSYSETEPLAGLEERVLRRIRVKEAAPARWFATRYALVGGLAVLAVVAALNFSSKKEVSAPKTVEVAVAGNTPVAPQNPEIETQAVPVQHVPRFVPVAKTLPKQDQFPMPTPATEGESALAAFFARDPEQAVHLYADLRNRSNEEVRIPEIVIPLLPQGDGE